MYFFTYVKKRIFYLKLITIDRTKLQQRLTNTGSIYLNNFKLPAIKYSLKKLCKVITSILCQWQQLFNHENLVVQRKLQPDANYLGQGGHVYGLVCCLYVCQQAQRKNIALRFMKLTGRVQYGPGRNSFHFWSGFKSRGECANYFSLLRMSRFQLKRARVLVEK